MFKLDYVVPEQAEGRVKQAYSVFPPEVGVPLPLQLYSASPGILKLAVRQIGYFMQHPAFEFPLLAAIRFIAASEFCYDACIDLNGSLLRRAGLSQAELDGLLGDLEGVPFEAGEIALLRFVQKVVHAPGEVRREDVQACRDAGWSDAEIFDAGYHASYMQANERLMTAFAG